MPAPDASDLAMKHLEKLLGKDPILKDIIHQRLPRTSGGPFVPDVDVIETDDAYIVLLDVPGIARSALSIALDGAKLVVTGEKRSNHPEGARARVKERAVGPFRREFALPSSVDGHEIGAKLEDGVLRVTLPKVRSGKIKVDIG
jgi:HSP20 family protein